MIASCARSKWLSVLNCLLALGLVLVVLPASVRAQIKVSIVAGKTGNESSIKASGSVQHVITDKERGSFGIEDRALKEAVDAYFGEKPNDAYVKSPARSDDLYKKYDWPQVQTVVGVTGARILSVTSKPVIVSTQTFTNHSSKAATFNCAISQSVQTTTESNWSTTDTVEVGQKIEYGVSFIAEVKGETSLTYSHSWGQGGSQSESVTVGSDSGVSVELQPGESVKATLTASRGELSARVSYEAHLIGDAAVNYNPTHKGHHFWGLGIQGIMGAKGITNSKTYTEDITVGFYTDSMIEVVNATTNTKMATKVIPAMHQ
ncbi:MAG: hypothetical protein PSV13_20200 [Lacunisphaera sp.]|nr:hypothetical protein [Lacunisphaera sp.]